MIRGVAVAEFSSVGGSLGVGVVGAATAVLDELLLFAVAATAQRKREEEDMGRGRRKEKREADEEKRERRERGERQRKGRNKGESDGRLLLGLLVGRCCPCRSLLLAVVSGCSAALSHWSLLVGAAWKLAGVEKRKRRASRIQGGGVAAVKSGWGVATSGVRRKNLRGEGDG